MENQCMGCSIQTCTQNHFCTRERFDASLHPAPHPPKMLVQPPWRPLSLAAALCFRPLIPSSCPEIIVHHHPNCSPHFHVGGCGLMPLTAVHKLRRHLAPLPCDVLCHAHASRCHELACITGLRGVKRIPLFVCMDFHACCDWPGTERFTVSYSFFAWVSLCPGTAQRRSTHSVLSQHTALHLEPHHEVWKAASVCTRFFLQVL